MRRHSVASSAISSTTQSAAESWALKQKLADLAHEVCATILIERNVFYLGKTQAGLTQTAGNGSGGKTSSMLNTAESFLRGGSDQLAVLH